MLLGALTGRDGIGGASVLASAELGEGDEAKRPSVQIGDPFTEKKLLECCLELLDRELLVSLQDLGAAGLTSAASEMASKGGVGLTLDLCQIPLREPDMEPFEIMVSESQERMLCVAAPECVGELLDVCERWEVPATTIGCVTEGDSFRVLHRGGAVAELPVSVLVDDCPLYDLEPAPPAAGLYEAAGCGADRGRVAGGDAARAAPLAQPRLAPACVRAVRPDRPVAHRAPARRGRRRRARAARRVRRSRSRSMGTGGAWPAIRVEAPPRPCTSARRTWPASAPSRSG